MTDTLSGTNYVLRPEYDATVRDIGEPLTGFPAECEFAWPQTSEEELDALAVKLVGIKASYEESRAKVTRDGHGRFFVNKATAQRACQNAVDNGIDNG